MNGICSLKMYKEMEKNRKKHPLFRGFGHAYSVYVAPILGVLLRAVSVLLGQRINR